MSIRLVFLLFLVATTVLFLTSACSEDPSDPGPPPDLALSLRCDEGMMALDLRNAGGAMKAPALFEAVFGDGRRDTLYLRVDEADSVSCQLTNIHGSVTVSCDEWGLTASAEDCLTLWLEPTLADFDINSVVPRPLTRQDIVICTYSVYLNTLTYDGPTFEIIRDGADLVLQHIYENINGDLDVIGGNWACADFDGDLSIDTMVAQTIVLIREGESPEVVLGETKVVLEGLDFKMNTVVDEIISFFGFEFESMFGNDIQNEIQARLNDRMGSDLSSLVMVRSLCEE